MKTTMVFRVQGFIGIMEKRMEATMLSQGKYGEYIRGI